MPTVTLYHGTSYDNGKSIKDSNRIRASSSGLCGPGVYAAGKDKVGSPLSVLPEKGRLRQPQLNCLVPMVQAKGFAQSAEGRGKGRGQAVVKISVTYSTVMHSEVESTAWRTGGHTYTRTPGFLPSSLPVLTSWRGLCIAGGYDGIRCNRTSSSSKEEWCFNPDRVTIVIEDVELISSGGRRSSQSDVLVLMPNGTLALAGYGLGPHMAYGGYPGGYMVYGGGYGLGFGYGGFGGFGGGYFWG